MNPASRRSRRAGWPGLVVTAGQDDLRAGFDAEDPLERPRPVQVGHGQVQDDRADLRRRPAHRLHGLLAVARRQHREPMDLHHGRTGLQDHVLVVHDEDAPLPRGRRRRARGHPGRWAASADSASTAREQHPDRSTLPPDAVEQDRAAVAPHDPEHRGHAEPAAVNFVVKNGSKIRFCVARSPQPVSATSTRRSAPGAASRRGGSDPGQSGIAVPDPGGERDHARLAPDGLGRVRDQVHDHLLDLPGVGFDGGRAPSSGDQRRGPGDGGPQDGGSPPPPRSGPRARP